MSFTLDKVVPWGRSFDEYAAMFALSADDLRKRILGCGDGPASFNAVLTRQGGRVVSVDPLYRFSAEEIRRRIAETYPQIMDQTRRNLDEFVWTSIKSIDELGRLRMAAMDEFLADYAAGTAQQRYLAGELPKLPFRDGEFELALSSHFLFLYSAQFSHDFHVESIRELCRVAGEARIFPLLELGAKPSRHVKEVTARLAATGYEISVTRVSYEFQRGGHQMMRVRRTRPQSAAG